jgi:spermidine synthase
MNNVTISEDDGVRSLHFGTKWVQGAMRLERPDAIELEYVQQMMIWTLFLHNPGAIAQLGLGAGSLTKFCHRQFPLAAIRAVELDPTVTAICRSHFALPPDDSRLRVVHMDAMAFVLDEQNHGAFDVLQVDLYDADAKGPVLDTAEFYQACAQCLTPTGIMTVNLFCDYPDHGRNLKAMEPFFDAVAWLPEVHDGNVVAIGFKEAPSVDFSLLEQRAARIERDLGLPAGSWVEGLQAWMQGG